MAVVLNGEVISSPRLLAVLRDRAVVTGHFSQREVSQLAADLKAGSLSFTPKIFVAEENISPDLGQSQRTHGIIAGAVGFVLADGPGDDCTTTDLPVWWLRPHWSSTSCSSGLCCRTYRPRSPCRVWPVSC